MPPSGNILDVSYIIIYTIPPIFSLTYLVSLESLGFEQSLAAQHEFLMTNLPELDTVYLLQPHAP